MTTTAEEVCQHVNARCQLCRVSCVCLNRGNSFEMYAQITGEWHKKSKTSSALTENHGEERDVLQLVTRVPKDDEVGREDGHAGEDPAAERQLFKEENVTHPAGKRSCKLLIN